MNESVTEITAPKRRVLTPRRMLLAGAMVSLGFLNAGCLQAIQGAFRVAGEVLGSVQEIAEPILQSVEAFQNGDVAGGINGIFGAAGAGGNALDRVGGAIGGLVQRKPAGIEVAEAVRTQGNDIVPGRNLMIPDLPAAAPDAEQVRQNFRAPGGFGTASTKTGPVPVPKFVPTEQPPQLNRGVPAFVKDADAARFK